MMVSEDNIKEVTHVKTTTPHSPFSGDKTYSSLFLPNMFDVVIDRPVYDFFVNCYIDDYGLSHLFDKPLFVLLKTEKLDNYFQAVESLITSNKNFVYTYPVGTNYGGYLFMYVFECPKVFEKDYDRFKNGEYSSFSKELKMRYPRLIPMQGRAMESPIYGALFKTQYHRGKVEEIVGEKIEKGQELWATPKPDYEIFRFKN